VLEEMRGDPVEQNAYPRPMNASGSMIQAGWELVERGAPAPTDADTPGRAVLFMLALGKRDDFRPAGWQDTAAGLLRHPIPYVRSVTLENLGGLPLDSTLEEAVVPLLDDRHVAVSVPACNLAGSLESERFREPLLAVLRATDDQWLLRAAQTAAIQCGAPRDRVLEICIDQLERPGPSDSRLHYAIFGLMIEVVEQEAGYGTSHTDWSQTGAVCAAWREFLEDHREEIRAGNRFKIAEPPLTRSMFPRGFQFGRQDKPGWPDWSNDP